MATVLEITVLFSTNFCWICRWSVLNPIGDVNVRYSTRALLSLLKLVSPEPAPSAWGSGAPAVVPSSPEATRLLLWTQCCAVLFWLKFEILWAGEWKNRMEPRVPVLYHRARSACFVAVCLWVVVWSSGRRGLRAFWGRAAVGGKKEDFMLWLL